jgi:transposase InsO family protein
MPATPKGLHQQLCCIGYWRKYIPGFAKQTQAIHEALKEKRWRKGIPEEAKTALLHIRKELLKENGAFLWHPDFSPEAGDWKIKTDASLKGLGAHLLQKIDGEYRPVHFASRRLSQPEKRYSIHKLEALAIIWAVRLFHQFIWNKPFTIYSDNAACKYLKDADKGLLARWALELSTYDMKIEHIKGENNVVSDCLSRHPLEEQEEEIAAVSQLIPAIERITEKDLATAQRKEGEWTKKIIDTLNRGEPAPEYFLEGNVLCSTFRERKGKKKTLAHEEKIARVALPRSLVKHVLRHHHTLPIAGHRGFKKTLRLVGTHFTWPGMGKDTRDMIHGCLACKRKKTPMQRAGSLSPLLIANKPAEYWAVDLQTGLPPDREGNTILLTAVDMFSRWALAIPVKDRSTNTITDAIYRHIILQHGIPKALICDNEGAFVAKDMKNFQKTLHFSCIVGAAYAPWHQGHVERFHAHLNKTLSMLTDKFMNNWRDILDEVMLAYRVSSHESMDGLSPFEIHYGRKCRLPSEILTGINRERKEETPTAYHQRQAIALKKAFAWVRESQEKRAAKNKIEADSKSKHTHYREGDQVLVYRPEERLKEREENASIPRRYLMHWSKPRTIVRELNENTYLVRKNGNKNKNEKDTKVHVRHLIHYSPWKENSQPPPPNTKSNNARTTRAQTRSHKKAADNQIEKEPAPKGETHIGEFALIKHRDKNEPYLIGKLLMKQKKHREKEQLMFHLYGSFKANPNLSGALKPGWVDKQNKRYYREKRQHHTHAAYTNHTRKLRVREEHVAMRGFTLTNAHKLPIAAARIANTPHTT